MDMTQTETLRVGPSITLLNKYLHRVKQVAVQSIQPIYEKEPQLGSRLAGFHLRVEGPAKHLSHFHRLIDAAHLKIS